MKALLTEYSEIERPRNVGLISFSHGINEFYGLVIPPIIPLLVTDLDITYAAAGLLLTVFYAMYSIFQLPAGMIADRIGKKRLLVWGLVGMAIGLLVASTAQSYETLLMAKVLMGIAGSTYHPAGMAMVSDGETEETEGKAMGVFGLGGQIGVASAPVIIGGIAALIDWRTALLVAAAVGIIFTVVFQFLYRTPPSATPNGCSANEATDGGTDTAEPDDKSIQTNGDGSVASRVQTRIQRMLRFELTVGIVLISLVTLLVSLQIRSIQTFATGFVADGIGQTTSIANGVFFVMLAASAVSSIWVGSLADRFDRGRLGVLAAILTSLLLLSTILIIALEAALVDWMVTGLLVAMFGLLGLAVYGCTPIKNALISEYATTEASGSIFGVTQTASSAGSAAGPAIFGYIATEFSIAVAFPLIAVVGGVIAVGFYTLSRQP
ncbi:major facilitator superfamily protein [Natronococcus amylolyticus DSM 10524]|uniref:Major facilitator superfamily protein n=1 Tax=Natronococcus amylolyticus DSM 10524 TaxID=1227497 RepID=L9X346_9EURY|nr:MFS transporter [Natronococcus amylolyticus]ELY56017.1 major facilitator superfamily protein [Natronococcus amylolyticus DSM 10524]